jgi:hypothetical protein
MSISNNFFFRRIIQPSRLASVLILAGCALCLGLRAPVNHARTGAPANPLFTQETKLTASNGAAFHNFGKSVAISGATVVVGSSGGGPNGNQGAAYVFVRNGTSWYQQAILTASDGADGAGFGASVAIDGNTAVVGAPGALGPNGNQGAAYVFARNGTTWTQQQKLTVSDGISDGFDDYFGGSVAVSGDTVVAGASQVTLDNLV